MKTERHIIPPSGENDTAGAKRVLEEFLAIYHPVLSTAETHLEQVISKMEPEYASAYKPWQAALQDLCKGVYMMTKKIPVPDMERFIDALHMFSFEGAIQFLQDLCKSCKIAVQKDWAKEFRKHIDALLFAVSILHREQMECIQR